MKKVPFIFILLIPVLLFSCGHPCNDFYYSAPNHIAESYCRNMVPNNYWIYTNQDKTKSDSLYFTYVPGEKQGEDIVKNICAGWYQRMMHLHSTYLSASELEVLYYSYGVIGGTNLEFGDNNFPSSFLLIFYPDKDKCGGAITFKNDVSVADITYEEVIDVNGYYVMAPKIGIVQYVSYNQLDTFYLEKYYIQ